MLTERQIDTQQVEGEIGLVISYMQGRSRACDVLSAVLEIISALDALDHVLLSSIDMSLEPVSILNDIQQSSLKLLLRRCLKSIPDKHIINLDWPKWIGALLVQCKHLLLQHLDSDTQKLQETLKTLDSYYRHAPGELIGFKPPTIQDIRSALESVMRARAILPDQRIIVQTSLGDVELPYPSIIQSSDILPTAQTITNIGIEIFTLRSPDMIGGAMWKFIRNGRNISAKMLHRKWLEDYHNRQIALVPKDKLKCRFEEDVGYDVQGNETQRIYY